MQVIQFYTTPQTDIAMGSNGARGAAEIIFPKIGYTFYFPPK
jgi:hypothetical protein